MWWSRKKNQSDEAAAASAAQPSVTSPAAQHVPATQQAAATHQASAAQQTSGQPAAGQAPPERAEVEFIKNSGGCLASKNILAGLAPVKWMVRESSKAPADNGWIFMSAADDEAFMANMAANFEIVSFNRMCNIEPALIGIYDFPVGSDLDLVRTPEGPMFFVDVTTGQRIPTEAMYVPPQFRA